MTLDVLELLLVSSSFCCWCNHSVAVAYIERQPSTSSSSSCRKWKATPAARQFQQLPELLVGDRREKLAIGIERKRGKKRRRIRRLRRYWLILPRFSLIHSLVWCGLPSTLNHFPLLSIRTSYVSWSPCFVAFLLLQSRGLLISQGVFFSFPFFFLFFFFCDSVPEQPCVSTTDTALPATISAITVRSSALGNWESIAFSPVDWRQLLLERVECACNCNDSRVIHDFLKIAFLDKSTGV